MVVVGTQRWRRRLTSGPQSTRNWKGWKGRRRDHFNWKTRRSMKSMSKNYNRLSGSQTFLLVNNAWVSQGLRKFIRESRLCVTTIVEIKCLFLQIFLNHRTRSSSQKVHSSTRLRFRVKRRWTSTMENSFKKSSVLVITLSMSSVKKDIGVLCVLHCWMRWSGLT